MSKIENNQNYANALKEHQNQIAQLNRSLKSAQDSNDESLAALKDKYENEYWKISFTEQAKIKALESFYLNKISELKNKKISELNRISEMFEEEKIKNSINFSSEAKKLKEKNDQILNSEKFMQFIHLNQIKAENDAQVEQIKLNHELLMGKIENEYELKLKELKEHNRIKIEELEIGSQDEFEKYANKLERIHEENVKELNDKLKEYEKKFSEYKMKIYDENKVNLSNIKHLQQDSFYHLNDFDVKISDNGENISIFVFTPNFEKENVNLSIQQDLAVISCKRKSKIENEKKNGENLSTYSFQSIVKKIPFESAQLSEKIHRFEKNDGVLFIIPKKVTVKNEQFLKAQNSLDKVYENASYTPLRNINRTLNRNEEAELNKYIEKYFKDYTEEENGNYNK